MAGHITAVRSPYVNDPTWMELVEVHKPPRASVPVENFHHLEEVAADTVFEGETPPAEKAESTEPTAAESVTTETTADENATEEASVNKPDGDSTAESAQSEIETEPDEPVNSEEDAFGNGLDAADDTDAK